MIKDNKLVSLIDSFELKVPKKSIKELRDSVTSDKSLIVKVKATHGGYTNGNKFHYTIDSMSSVASTWVKPFPKPVLTHHEEKTDPIGRVTDAQFVSISTNRKNKPKGYVLLTLKVTDQDAIEKILDGRYMTVSVGSHPTSAICSICDRDLVADGMCDHKRGQLYDNEICFWTIDIKNYTEVSFVNKPADEYQFGIESADLTDNTEEDDMDFAIDINKAEFYLEDNVDSVQNDIIEKKARTTEDVASVKSKTKDKMEGIKMEEDVKKLQDEITELKTKISTSQTSYEDLKKEKESLDAQITEKTEENQKLSDEIIKYKAEQHKNLADNLYTLRKKLGKKDVVALKSEDEITAYKEVLSNRSHDSLNDAITDLKLEVVKEKKEVKEPTEQIDKKSVDTPEEKQVDKKTKKEVTDETKIEKDLADDLHK